MKTTINLPISLSQILLNVTTHTSTPTRAELSEMVFDTRHDFMISQPELMLAVRMVFANERALADDASKGIRRKVTVSLIDADTNKLYATTTASVAIKAGSFCGQVTVTLPFKYDDVDFNHSYRVVVRDLHSKQTLGYNDLWLFPRFLSGVYATDLLKPDYAGFAPNFTTLLHKSIDAEPMEFHYVRFFLTPDERAQLSEIVPEMEVRVLFPDGSMETRFVAPEEYPLAWEKTFLINVPFFLTPSRKGLTYTELLCFDEVIAAFIFDTAGETRLGSWHDDELAPIDHYSFDDIARHAKELLPPPEASSSADEETAELPTDDDFDKALEEFIRSNTDEEAPDPSAPESTPESAPDPVPEPEAPEPKTATPAEEQPVSPLKSLESLTGLRSVKEKLTAYEKLVMFNKMRKQNDLPTLQLPLHAMFLGSPGTGKTTVAKRMGLMLYRAGMLSKGHVVVKERATLIGPLYSNEETNTLAAIEEAQGGILFIDEAYQLYQQNDQKDPGKFVIETLMTALADESKRDWMLILAGYTDEMKRMFEMNPGLRSRIPDSNIYVFDDFSEAELMEIAERYLARNSYSLSDEAHTALANRLSDDWRNRTKSFGNARHVINMIQSEILPSMASRVVSANITDPAALSLIEASDIPQPNNPAPAKRSRIGYCA